MEYVRLGYDQIFLIKKYFLKYNNEKIKSLSVMLKYHLYSKETGLEILFEKNENYIDDTIKIEIGGVSETSEGVTIQNLKRKTITDFVSCFFHKEELINIVVNEKELADLGYRLEYEIVNYFKDLLKNGTVVPTQISKDEFYKIMKTNIDEFDNSNNYPTQTVGFEVFDKKEKNFFDIWKREITKTDEIGGFKIVKKYKKN